MGAERFHLAFPVRDLEASKRFYVDGLGCGIGRMSKQALILDFRGHQIVAQLTHAALVPQQGIYPRHFGLVFERKEDWDALIARAREKQLRFYQEPRVRYAGTRLEHHTVFLEDPSFNLLEFKWYRFESAIFGEEQEDAIGDHS